MSCRAVSCVTPCHAVSRRVVLCRVVWCRALLCRIVPDRIELKVRTRSSNSPRRAENALCRATLRRAAFAPSNSSLRRVMRRARPCCAALCALVLVPVSCHAFRAAVRHIRIPIEIVSWIVCRRAGVSDPRLSGISDNFPARCPGAMHSSILAHALKNRSRVQGPFGGYQNVYVLLLLFVYFF